MCACTSSSRAGSPCSPINVVAPRAIAASGCVAARIASARLSRKSGASPVQSRPCAVITRPPRTCHTVTGTPGARCRRHHRSGPSWPLEPRSKRSGKRTLAFSGPRSVAAAPRRCRRRITQRAHCRRMACATSACAQCRACGKPAAPSTSSGCGQGLITSVMAWPISRSTTQPRARPKVGDGPPPTAQTRRPSRTINRFETTPRLCASASPRSARTHHKLLPADGHGSRCGASAAQARVALGIHNATTDNTRRHSVAGIPCFSLERDCVPLTHDASKGARMARHAGGTCFAPSSAMHAKGNDKHAPWQRGWTAITA